MCRLINIKWLFIILLVFTIPSTMNGQDTITLDQAIATALKNNYDIMIARNDSSVAGINFSYRNWALLPQVNASGTVIFNDNAQSQTYSGNIVKSRKGITSNNANAGLNATWVLFNGFKMFVIRDRLQKLLTLGTVVAKNQVVNTVSDVIKIYYDIVRQEQLLKNIEEQIHWLNHPPYDPKDIQDSKNYKSIAQQMYAANCLAEKPY